MKYSLLGPQEDHSKKGFIHTSVILEMKKSKGTELSKYIWKLKTNNKSYELKWYITYKIGELNFQPKKIKIALTDEERNLNKKQELF